MAKLPLIMDNFKFWDFQPSKYKSLQLLMPIIFKSKRSAFANLQEPNFGVQHTFYFKI